MSKINLKNFVNEESDVLVFNNGTAGRVKNVRVEVSKRKPEDKPRSPDYKINFIDESGGTVNLGVYYPTEKTSPKEIHIRMNQLFSILSALNPSITPESELPEFDTHKQAYDYLIQEIAKASKSAFCNVFVSYGIKRAPSRYLGFRAYNMVEAANTPDDKTRLKPNFYSESPKNDYNDVMTRLEPTDFGSENTNPFSSNSDNDKEEDIVW